MCGIHVCISRRSCYFPRQTLQDLLRNRGPDHIGHQSTQFGCKNGFSYHVDCTSTVLALRGGQITHQPFVDPASRALFCWNGEAWKIGLIPVDGNDGQVLFGALVKASSQPLAADATRAILKVLRAISGPFAFFFLDHLHSDLYFGRDRLGRRSLLLKQDAETLELASIPDSLDPSWHEVEADGIYHISLRGSKPSLQSSISEDNSSLSLAVRRHNWDVDSTLIPSMGVFNKVLPSGLFSLDLQSQSIQILREQLMESLKLRVLNVPVPPGLDQEHSVRIAILFSGGLDCTVLARMVHDILPEDQHIDLINVAFENPRVIQAARNVAKLKKPQGAAVNVQANVSEGNNPHQVLASSAYENCPDRETGRKAFQELQRVCPGRFWRFVAVNVPYSETLAHRSSVIGLIHPHNTEMDLSIAYALYFAGRGKGVSSDDDSDSPIIYATPARVLLSGLGADELFGGYTRHATAFDRRGYEGLLDELELDVNRLGKRNLGRDDRVISHWGKEARFPYLDESLVKWAVECPIWEKCGFQTSDDAPEDPEIEPGKKVLRLLAYSLGMHSVAKEKKRAIQFGARTAKMEAGRTKGTQLIS